MSRSYKKRKFCGLTSARSEKKDKKTWHKKLRMKIKELVNSGEDFSLVSKDKHAVSDVWSFSKDGKQYYGNLKTEMKKWQGMFDHGQDELYTDEYIERAYFECDRK
jgi:hypothetical protein